MFINYDEFYETSLLTMGERDRLTLEQGNNTSNDSSYTHWLFALEGQPIDAQSNYYHWRIVIYPSTDRRHMNYEQPFYVSTYHQSFEKAYQFIKSLEEQAKQGHLATTYKKEKKMA